jgi:hypothetical protein
MSQQSSSHADSHKNGSKAQAASWADYLNDIANDPDMIACFDLDHCVDDADEFDPWAEESVYALNSATEFSARENMILKLIRKQEQDSAQ